MKGKDVFVVDDHHRALATWTCVRRGLEQAPNLITIDHHTDTDEAFLGYAWMEGYEGQVDDPVVPEINSSGKFTGATIKACWTRLASAGTTNTSTLRRCLGFAATLSASSSTIAATRNQRSKLPMTPTAWLVGQIRLPCRCRPAP